MPALHLKILEPSFGQSLSLKMIQLGCQNFFVISKYIET